MKGLAAVGRVGSTRIIGDKTAVETWFSQNVQQHWSIENRQHWVLDVQLGKTTIGPAKIFAGKPGFNPASRIESVE